MTPFLDAVLVDARLVPRLAEEVAALAARVPIATITPGAAAVTEALGRLGAHPSRTLIVGGADLAAAVDAAGASFTALHGDGLLAAVDGWAADTAAARVSAAVAAVSPPDASAAQAAEERQRHLTKPRGALGELETLGNRLAAMAGRCPPPVPAPATVAVFAADHGVVAEGVTPWPQEVTAQMVANVCAGGAAVNVLARQAGAAVVAVDVGVASPLPASPGLLRRKVRAGTANLALGPAMARDEATAAVAVGVDVAAATIHAGSRCLVTGDMGIGNTTASAAVIASLTGRPAGAVTGRGTGIDDTALAVKTRIVAGAAERAAGMDPLGVLAEVGGLEIAAVAGFVLGGAGARVPVVLDGVISLAGALCAEALSPGVRAWCVAGHRSVEPGATVALDALGLRPLVDLGLRLGEGTGAVLALPLVEAAARILREMATFDSAGVTDKEP